MAIQPTIGMIPIRPWMIILPNQPGSWNGHAKLSPTLVIGGIVSCAGQGGKVRPAIYPLVDTDRPTGRFLSHNHRPKAPLEPPAARPAPRHAQANALVAALPEPGREL